MIKLYIPYYNIEASKNHFAVYSSKGLPTFKKAFQKKLIHALSLHPHLEIDQVLEIRDYLPLHIEVWNKDTSKAAMCGNGACALLHLAEKNGWLGKIKEEEKVKCIISQRSCEGKRLSRPASYELYLGPVKIKKLQYLSLKGEKIPYFPVKLGNSHAIIFIGQGEKEWNKSFSASLGAWAAQAAQKLKANISLVQVEKENQLKIRFWELGAGATKSCASGAIASVAAFQSLLKEESKEMKASYSIHTEGGNIHIRQAEGKLFLTSSSSILGKGILDLEYPNAKNFMLSQTIAANRQKIPHASL